jgi:hypothetical protein
MITFPTSQIQNADLSHGSSIRHHDGRANPRLRSQLVHRSSLLKADTYARSAPFMRGTSLLKADTYARSAPFMRGNVVDQRTHGCRLPSARSSAARKSP